MPIEFPDQKLREYLNNLGINYKTIQHQALFSMEDLEAVKDKIQGIIPKNLFLKADKQFILVCTPENKRLDLKALAEKLGVKSKKLRFGFEEELWEHLKIKKGSVSIYCLVNNHDIPVYLDQSIWDSEITAFHPNNNEYTIEVNHAGFVKFWNSLPNPKELVTI
jgi:Ala-tRNA(Pro) deacylase